MNLTLPRVGQSALTPSWALVRKRVWYHLIIVLVYLVGFKSGPRSHSHAPLGSLARSLQVGGDASVLLRSALTYMQSTTATHGHGSSTHASHCIIGCLLELLQEHFGPLCQASEGGTQEPAASGG